MMIFLAIANYEMLYYEYIPFARLVPTIILILTNYVPN